MSWSLIVNTGKNRGMSVSLCVAQFLIGREKGCQLRPSSDRVGGAHCLLITRPEGLFLRDLGCPGGTLVNGMICKEERQLRDGDRTQIGPLEFIIRAPVVTEPAPETSEPTETNEDVEDIAGRLLSDMERDPNAEDLARHSSDTVTEMGLTPGEVPALPPGTPFRPNHVASKGSDASISAKEILETYRQRRSRMRTNRGP